MTETQNTSRRPGALIAMSGGVDSSVAAWLMQRDGFDCTGVTMRLTRNEAVNTEGLHTCCSERDIEDAAEVAYAMDIPYEVLDFTADFQEKIIDKFIRVYEAGGTPNPCIDCNKYMKFDHLLRWAEAHGLDHVVTGHYARVEQDEATGRWLLKKGLDENKDQSYVLYNLTQEQLAHVRLPLGGLHKSEVRAIAEQQHFVNARKHDSQDICFVPDGDYAAYIEEEAGVKVPEGNFVLTDGTVLGRHKGITHYTVGQRKGLGLALGYPAFVLEIRPETNEVVIGTKEESMTTQLRARNLNFMAVEDLTEPLHVFTKIRYNHKGAWCTIEKTGEDEVLCTFDEPQRAVTPGQAVVFYDREYVLGGGTIQ